MSPNRRDFLALGVGALAVATLPRALRRPDRLIRRQLPVMGTTAEIAIRHPNEQWAHRAMDAAFSELRRVDRIMSRYRADSDVSRLNDAAGRGPVPVSDDTAEVLAAALRWAESSEGCFDPCIGHLSDVWDVSERTTPPAGARLSDVPKGGLFRALDVSKGTMRSAQLSNPMASVDLGGIAKGHAVDLAAAALRDQGVFNALVNVGGDLVALGSGAGEEPWRVGVRSPDHRDRMVEVLSVSDEAVATSGDYLRYFQHAGRRYHHLMDPRAAAPRRTAMRSLTVGAATCMEADAAATALFGMEEHVMQAILLRAEEGVRVLHRI